MADERQEQPQSVSKTEAIQRLRQTIQRLEAVVTQLDAESPQTLPSVAALDSLTTDVERLATALGTPASPVTIETDEDAELGFIDRILPTFDRVQNGWDWVLVQIRRVLPTALDERLSDWAITGILAATTIAVLSTAVILTSLPGVPVEPTAATETEIVRLPPPEPEPEVVEPPPAVADVPPAAVEAPPAAVEPPASLPTPKPPAPVAKAPVTPPVVLTPEQRLVASIQNRVAQMTGQYAEGLIDTVEANFLASRLSVKLEDEWYELPESQQDRIANQMWTRSRDLDFSKLELLDGQGNLLARSPVVGETMVILRRSRLGI
jgi:hypothetical protein